MMEKKYFFDFFREGGSNNGKNFFAFLDVSDHLEAIKKIKLKGLTPSLLKESQIPFSD